MRWGRRLGVAGVGLVALVATAAACSGNTLEAFCEAAEASRQAGPLLPDRADGAPVIDPGALAAIEGLADDVPGEIADAVDVVVAEAVGLAAEIESRRDESLGAPPEADRPDRAAVEAAQAELVTYVAQECGIDLTDG